MRVAPVLCLAAALAAPLPAQQLRPGLLLGRITDAAGAPVPDASIRATQGARTLRAESEGDGDFRLGGLGAGTWTIAIRRLGFRPLAVDVEMPAEGLRRTFVLETVTLALDPVLVAAKWTGVRGLVGDSRRITPLAGASVRLLGSDAAAASDGEGRFALPFPGDRAVLLRVQRAGFETRLLSVQVPADGYVELDVVLDTLDKERNDAWMWRDLDQRLKFASPRAALVGREDIEATDAVALGTALSYSRAVIGRGVIITRRACLFVNGVPRPGMSVDAILAGEVEFVEAYPPGTDLTRTLARSWPTGAECGVPDRTLPSSRIADRQKAQFISVWLRTP